MTRLIALLLVSLVATADTPPTTRQLPVSASNQDEGRWYFPVSGASAAITHWYEAPSHRYGPGHRGIDLASAPNTPVYAPTFGTVTFAGTVADREVLSFRTAFGLIVSLEPVTSHLVEGDEVHAGMALGVLSTGGHCENSCVHLGVRRDGEYVNPMRFLTVKPMLLPIIR